VTRADPDRLLLRRARRTLAIQHTAALAVILLIVGAVALLVVTHGQRAALRNSLQQTAATEEDVVDPPEDSWIFRLSPDGKLEATEHAPDGFPDRAALDRVRAGGRAETGSRETRGIDYLIVTRRRGGTTVQVVGSLADQEAERRRLFMALAGAELLGLLASAGTGVLLARRATAPLGDALDRQRRFVADASHELRTPLAQLHTRAQLLRRDLREGAAAADVDRLVAGTRELGEVVEDLLLSTQGKASGGTEVDLGVLAAAVLAAADGHGVELDLVTDPDQPSVVRGREPALRRVLTGLVDNALSHTAPGGHVTIELGRQHDGRQVTLVVRDDGTGFDPADAKRIFDRFARGHDDHRRFGLGLALAREVITGHGGTIEAHGVPGRGATFTIRLPLQQQPTALTG
jgi:two-component system, OmpR family, sensor kinase